MLANNPLYTIAYDANEIKLYIPAQETKYHASRFVAMQEQQIYSSHGMEKDVLVGMLNAMVDLCNSDKPVASFRTDIGTMCNNLLYRTQYPIDNKVALRTGAILTFMEDENPDTIDVFWINKKLSLADKYPDLYAFFLTLGLNNLNVYTSLLDTSIDLDYFRKREEAIQALLPQSKVK